jgi:hypothetical protein
MKIALTNKWTTPKSIVHGYYEIRKWFLERYDIDVYLHGWKD